MYIKEITQTRERNLLMNLLSEFKFNSIKQFQEAAGLGVDGVFGSRSFQALYNLILKPKELFFSDYVPQIHPKTQIVWHTSAGWDNARQMFKIWQLDKRGKVATAVGVTDDGQLVRGFNEKYFAYHLGCKQRDFNLLGLPNIGTLLERESIGIEVCGAGSLDENGKSWWGYEPPKDRVIELNYKGFKLFETVTDAECKTLKYWTLLNAMRWAIPLYYREFEMWNLSRDALTGVRGLYTHNSFRNDKNDISPQPNVIKTAKELSEYYS